MQVEGTRSRIGLEGIKMEQEKVKNIWDQPTPKGVKDIQKFLGLANYYYWFIKDFARYGEKGLDVGINRKTEEDI